MSKRRKTARQQRGFALIAVVILMALMTAAVAVALDDAVVAVRNGGSIRSTEIIKSGLDRGVNLAILALQDSDPSYWLAAPDQHDLFSNPGATPVDVPGVGQLNFTYPDNGPYANQYRVVVGLRPRQRTRAPVGNNVNKGFGQIFEIQVGVSSEANSSVPPAEQRVTVGVLVPRQVSHAN